MLQPALITLIALSGLAGTSGAEWKSDFADAEVAAKKHEGSGDFRAASEAYSSYARRWSPLLASAGAIECPPPQSGCREAVSDNVIIAINRAGNYNRLQALSQRAQQGDDEAWTELTRKLLAEGQGRYLRVRTKSRDFRRLVEKDPRLIALIAQSFPARAEVKLSSNFGVLGRAALLQALERGGDEVGLRIVDGGEARSTLHVEIEIEESDTSGQAIFKGNSMKSYALSMVAELKTSDGAVIARSYQHAQSLGISVPHAVRYSMYASTRKLLRELVKDMLYRAHRDDL